MQITTSWHQRGKEEGLKEGEIKTKMNIAKKMLAQGKQIKEIMDLTGLSESEIQKLSE